MKETNCPYIKISQEEADFLALYSPENSESFLAQRKEVIVEKGEKNLLANFSLISKAEAQSVQPGTNFNPAVFGSLTFPFYILFGSFFLFIILMSFVYFYHWKKFTMNDPFINSFIPIYFLGLFVLILPIIYNLF